MPELTSNCRGVLLPYYPDFCYAALKTTDSVQDDSLLVLSSEPTHLTNDVYVLDVSEMFSIPDDTALLFCF